jgi:hypothetical protein
VARSFKVYQGEDETPVFDLTDPTSQVHVIWEEIEAGGRAFRGESTSNSIPIRDEQAETGSPADLPGGLTHVSLSRGSKWEWLDGPAGDVRMAVGRIGTKDYSRGRQKADRAREVVMQCGDRNEELQDIIVDDWVRPEETDVARVLALLADYLTGSPRVTTTIADTYVAAGNTVTMDAKTYDGTNPHAILSEIASYANKEFFVTIDDELWYDTADSLTYPAGIRISDRLDEVVTDGVCSDGFASLGTLGSNATFDPDNYAVTSDVTGPNCERVALTLPRDVPVGHSIVLILGSKWQSDWEIGLGDDEGNSYEVVATANESAGAPFARVAIAYCNVSNPLSSGQKIYYEVDVGISLNTNLERGGKCISAWEFSGTIASGVQSGSNWGISSTPSVTVGAGDLIVAGGDENGGASGFPDVITEDGDWTGFTADGTTAASADAAQIWGGFRLNDADGEAYNATIDQGRDWAMAGAVFTTGVGEGGEGLLTFPPKWDVGPASTEDGLELVSGLRLYYGQDGAYVYVNDATTVAQYWRAERSFYTSDPAINDSTKATVLANAILARLKVEDRTYNVSIGPLNENQVGCIKPGQLTYIKARAIPDADDQFQPRRIAQLKWTTPVPGVYWARMQLNRPLKEAPYGVGPKASHDAIEAHKEGDSHPASAITIIDAGAYFTGNDVEAALQELGASGGGPHTHDADDVNIADAGGYYTGTEVEAALQEIGADLAAGGGGTGATESTALFPGSTITATKDSGNPTFNFNMVPETMHKIGDTYYAVGQNGAGSQVILATATNRDGPWTLYGSNPIFTFAAATWAPAAATVLYAPELTEHDGTFYLFYSVCSDSTGEGGQIGVATATDITGPYTDSGAAILTEGAASSPTSLRVGEPSVIYHDGRWLMALMGEDEDAAFGVSEKIFMAEATSPTGPYTLLDGDPVIDFGGPGSGYAALVADPHLFFENGYFWMMVVGADDSGPATSGSQLLFYALDPAGPWTFHAEILPPGAGGSWDDTWAFRGCIWIEDGLLSGIYAGYPGGALTTIKGGNFRLTVTAPESGTADHGALTGLGDDDHTQYLNEARHDALDHGSAASHRLVVLHDFGTGLEPVTDGTGHWLYGAFPGPEH